jgi:hypothetical protein
MPIPAEWEKNRAVLRPLCTSGVIAYKTKEALIEFFQFYGIIAEEDNGSSEEESTTKQLLMF